VRNILACSTHSDLRRHSFTLAASVSFLLCLSSLAMDVRSFHVGDNFVWFGYKTIVAVGSTRGELKIGLIKLNVPNSHRWFMYSRSPQDGMTEYRETFWERRGFEVINGPTWK